MEISVDKEIISSGEPVTYTFKLRNKGDGDLTDVELIDDQFGIIVAGLTLKKGEIKAFNHTAVLSVAKKNCAEATAKYDGESIGARACIIVEIRT